MPTSVIAAVAADAIGTAVADALIFDVVAATTFDWVASYAVIQAGTSFLAGSVLRGALSGGAEQSPTSSPAFTSQAQARTHVIRSSVANRQIIYGRAMVSGPLLFAATDASNSTLHLVVALAGHECDAVEEIYFNDELLGTRDGSGNVTSGAYSGYAKVVAHLGASDQAADDDLVAAGLGWTSAHRLQGVTYLYVRLSWSRDVYPRGIPNIKAVVRGKKLYDPRSGLAAWSDNWALACRDYLAADYGLRCTDAEIDDTAIGAAANIADETVTLAAGGTEARYTCNGVMDTGQTPKAIMQALLSGGAGTLTWPSGVYTLAAGAYDTPAVTLDEDDLRGTVRVRARVARQDLYNAVKGTFCDPTQSWQPVDFPPLTNSTYEAQDSDERIWRDVAYPVTTSSATAQRLAKIALEKSRQGITVDAPCKLTAFKVRVWDTVQLSVSHLGWSSKVFRVTGWRFSESGGVDLTLQEEAAACYTWSAEETTVDPAPDTNLPDPRVVAVPGTPTVTESLFETTGSAGVKARASMAWAASTDAFVVDYLPDYRIAAGTWVALPATTGLTADINDIAPGSYEFRVRARNAIGAVSDYSGTRTQEILGLTAAPADPQDFYVVASDGGYEAEWALSADLDVKIGGRAVIRHSTLTSSATWNDGIVVREFNGDATAGRIPLMAGTYMLKFKDSSGNWSTGMASFVPSEALLSGYSTVGTSTQHPGFTGTKTNTAVLDGALRLDSTATITSMPGLVSAWPKLSALGGISGSGSYAFDTYLDLATVAARRFEATITAQSFDSGDLIGFRDLVSTWDSVVGTEVNDCDATLWIATTADDPAGSPAWGAWTPFFVGDFTCRAAKFRLDLASGSPTHNIAVSALSVRARVQV